MVLENKQGKRYAFVGSRDYPETSYDHIREAINVLPSHVTIISGGASGVDSVAVHYAKARRLKTEIISATVNGEFDSYRAFQRNEEIVEQADEVFAFWDMQSNGTRHAIRVAQLHQKPITVVLPSGVRFTPADVLNLSEGSVVYATGDILKANTDAVINPCNTQGVYGAGLSKAMSQKWSWWTQDYKDACRNGEIAIGRLHLSHPPANHLNDPVVIHFPTKDHWKDKSELSYIADGLNDFAERYKEWSITSIAIPKLGCGLGGLRWGRVKMYMEQALSDLSGIKVVIYV